MTGEAGEWGQASEPGERPRAIVLTFDNLGEASALERGTWDPETPVGSDPSVIEALPRLLDELARHDLQATFFVEAINCELNPRALHDIAGRGHELGVHGWSHEPWAELSARDEPDLLTRSTDAFARAGLPRPRGFRPPGGGLTPRTLRLLHDHGYKWCSPEGDAPRLDQGLAIVPFTWDLVDAYHLMESFGPMRRRRGDSGEPAAAPALADELTAALAAGTGVSTLILHPFLMLDEAWWHGARRLLGTLAGLRDDGAAWVTPGQALAARLTAEAQAA